MGDWKKLLIDSTRDIDGLEKHFSFEDDEKKVLREIAEKYPICIPQYYLDLIDKEDRNDPIRKMCMPDAMEFSLGGLKDTSGEADNTVMQGLQHKYRQTAMILSTNQCAMYCRHCFRKRMVGLEGDEVASMIPEMAEYVESHPEINNVLISGGDSFLNSNEVIRKYLEAFCNIDTIDYIRFGTRTPVVLPQRITEDAGLRSILREYGHMKQIVVVVQFNHPKELTDEAVKAIKMLEDAGCVIRNQTVLLKGVNDDPDILATLMNKLVSYGVMPYYIFQCRPVEGVKNQFQVPFKEGWNIVEKAKSNMNGNAKGMRFALSHPTGKIVIVGMMEDRMIFKYHQAKREEDNSRVFEKVIDDTQCWLEEI